MADRILKFGGVITVTTNPRICRITAPAKGVGEARVSRGSLMILRAQRVYVGWATASFAADETEEDNKVWLDVTGPVALRIPADVPWFVVKTAINTSALLYVAD